MNKKRKFWAFLSFYIINILVVVLTIAFWTDNRFVEILLAIYLMVLSGFFTYAIRRKRK